MQHTTCIQIKKTEKQKTENKKTEKKEKDPSPTSFSFIISTIFRHYFDNYYIMNRNKDNA
jgi:hypothetical protein